MIAQQLRSCRVTSTRKWGAKAAITTKAAKRSKVDTWSRLIASWKTTGLREPTQRNADNTHNTRPNLRNYGERNQERHEESPLPHSTQQSFQSEDSSCHPTRGARKGRCKTGEEILLWPQCRKPPGGWQDLEASRGSRQRCRDFILKVPSLGLSRL